MRIGLYAGTFDPLTLGHIDIIQRAAKLVDRLVIGVAINRDKGPLFSLDERVAMIEPEVEPLRAAVEDPGPPARPAHEVQPGEQQAQRHEQPQQRQHERRLRAGHRGDHEHGDDRQQAEPEADQARVEQGGAPVGARRGGHRAPW